MLKSQFGDLFYSRPIDELNISEFYTWRSSRLEQGKKATTVNKNIVALKAALKWGVKQGYIESNALEKWNCSKNTTQKQRSGISVTTNDSVSLPH
jgi:site-specific recombinase XerD